MPRYLVMAVYLALAAGAAAWFLYGRRAVLSWEPLYRQALDLLDRCEAYAGRRTIRVTAPTRAGLGLYSWREMLTEKQAAGLPALAKQVQAESLRTRRELADILMQAGQRNPWLRAEVMHIVGMIEESSGPDFIIRYGCESGAQEYEIRVPVMALYLDQDLREAG